MPKLKPILKGIPASPGRAEGRVKIVNSLERLKFSGKAIVVASFLMPPFVSQIKKNPSILGIITDGGGATCHAAIVARELKIPYIAGTISATRRLKKNSEIIMDSKLGLVYEKS